MDTSLDNASTGLDEFTLGTAPFSTDHTQREEVATSSRQTLENRVENMLTDVEQLTQLLAVDGAFQVPPLHYTLPAGFVLSIIVPVYNERDTIRSIIARVRALPIPTEIIVVDDYSTDGTRNVLRQLAGVPGLKVVFKPRNQGKGAALRTGFEYASGDIVAIQDADLEYDPRDIVSLIKPIIDGEADVVYGSRFLKNVHHDPSLPHRLGNRMLTWASNCFTGLRLTDMETCYKVFRRIVLLGISLRQNRFGFEPEITAKISRRRHRILEMPVTYNPRSWGDGKKIGLKDVFNALYCIVRYGLAD